MSSFQKKNHYEILDVSQDATVADINKAYRRLALKYHPDKTGGNQRLVGEFREVLEAVEILRDSAKRAKHDLEIQQQAGTYRAPFVTPFCGPVYYGYTGSERFDSIAEYHEYLQQMNREQSNPADIPPNRSTNEKYKHAWAYADHMRPDAKPRDAWAEEAAEQAQRDREEQRRREEKETEEERLEKEQAALLEARRNEAMGAMAGRDDAQAARAYWDQLSPCSDRSTPDCSSERTSSVSSRNQVYSTVSEEEEDDVVYDTSRDTDERESIESASRSSTPEQKDSQYYGGVLHNFFHQKLTNKRYCYEFSDLAAEVTGYVLEGMQPLFAGLREGLSQNYSKPVDSCIGTCNHLGPWNKILHADVCDSCNTQMPLYLLVCPRCGTKACLICKYSQE